VLTIFKYSKLTFISSWAILEYIRWNKEVKF